VTFTKAQALDAARNVITEARAAEAYRLDRIHRALKPYQSPAEYVANAQIPADAPPLMKELARKSETNYIPLLVKTFGQVMKADGYFSASDPDGTDPWAWWQRNRMDSRQTGLIRSTLQYGVGYATVLPGTYGRNQPGPAISLYSPRELTAVYQDPEADEWPMLAVGIDGDRHHVNLYDDENVYTFGLEPGATILTGRIEPAYSAILSLGRLTFLETKAHGLGVCPVIRCRDRNLLAGEEQYGIVEPLLTIQERINETTFQMQVAQYFAAFKQRYVLGWVPKTEQEEMKAGAARIWYLDEDPADVKIGELGETAIAPYIESRNSAIRDFSAIGQIPSQALGIDGISNISDATLAGLEAAKNREAGEITTSVGEGMEQMLRLCAYIDKNEAAADDYNSEIRWRDFEARSYAQTVDGLVKLAQGLGLPAEIVLEDVPGMTEQKLARAQESIRRQRGSEVLNQLIGSRPAVTDGDDAATA
jgi:hypothetical protein